MYDAYPKVKIVTAWVDEALNQQKYIVPGLGGALAFPSLLPRSGALTPPSHRLWRPLLHLALSAPSPSLVRFHGPTSVSASSRIPHRSPLAPSCLRFRHSFLWPAPAQKQRQPGTVPVTPCHSVGTTSLPTERKRENGELASALVFYSCVLARKLVYFCLSASPSATHSIRLSVPPCLPSQNGRSTAGSLTRLTLPPAPGSRTAPFSRRATMRRGMAAAVPLRVWA